MVYFSPRMSAYISLTHVSVNGIDTHARAASLRQWIARRKSLKPTLIPILSDVTFEAKPGDRIGVIGRNGCGKSSLLKVISGNYPIHAGKRTVEGSIAPLIEMGAGFDNELSGRRNIKLSYAIRGKLDQYSSELEEKIIEFSEIGDSIERPYKTYSSGMCSRLAFSSAIFQHPDILLLDEIFATGDAGFIEKSRQMMKERVEQAAIAIIVNHANADLIKMCNRYVLMDKGRIVNEGPPKEIVKQYHSDILKIPVPPALAGVVA